MKKKNTFVRRVIQVCQFVQRELVTLTINLGNHYHILQKKKSNRHDDILHPSKIHLVICFFSECIEQLKPLCASNHRGLLRIQPIAFYKCKCVDWGDDYLISQSLSLTSKEIVCSACISSSPKSNSNINDASDSQRN